RMPDLRILASLADFFNVSTDYLLGRTTLPHCYPRNKKELENILNGSEAIFKVAESQLDNEALYEEAFSETDEDEAKDN
ncbi:MAG: hypothetical protein GX763_00440, partial [Clostridiaceae bacterium]|nr:hypothetical protein [Clostridiaceae bacterium]